MFNVITGGGHARAGVARFCGRGSGARTLRLRRHGTVAFAATALAPIVRREGASLASAPVALVSLDGAPTGPGEDFRQALLRELAAHDVASASPKKARYLLQAYLSVAAAATGAELDYVLDVFDERRTRVARLSDEFDVKGSGDPWSQISTETLGSVAAKCAEDVAALLSNRPEESPR